MDIKRNIAVILIFAIFLVSSTWANSDLNSCLSSIDVNQTNSSQLDNKEVHTWESPLDALQFNRSVVGAKVQTYGSFETNFNIDPEFPESKQHTVLALYTGNPDSSKEFTGCAKISIIPLGSDYEEDPSNITNQVYSTDDLDTFEHSTNSGDFLYNQYSVDSIDTNGNPFVRWEVKRSFITSDNIYFNQGKIVEQYFSAVEEFKDGNQQAISNYRGELCSMNEKWTNNLAFCDQYQEAEVVGDIENNTEPDYNYEKPEPVTHQSPTNENITKDFITNNIIDVVNSHSSSLRNMDAVAGKNISYISSGDKIKASTLTSVKDALITNFETISKNSSTDFSDFEVSKGEVIERDEFDILVSNINTYNEEKMCTGINSDNSDWSCGSWNRCSGGTTSRSVERNRVCFSEEPDNSVTCQWELHQTGSTYRVGDCDGTIYRDDTYRDTLGTSVSDLCGNYNHGQWLGHTKTVTESVGTYDNCRSSN